MLAGTIIYALINAAILALMAMGFNLTFGISGVANFAYGAFYVLAAYGVWLMIHVGHLPYPLAVVLAIGVNLVLGMLLYRFVLQRLRGQALAEVIATFGIGLAILELFRYFGLVGFEYTLPLFSDASIVILDTYVDAQRLFVVVLAAALVALLWVFTHCTRTGLAFRGIAQDERTALTFGIDADRIAAFSVAFGAALAAVAATIIVPLGSISPEEGYDVLLKALAVCIIGGLGSSVGVIVASVLVGFAERITDAYMGSHWTMIVSLGAILAVLVLKPSGLFGKQKQVEERI
jgi:branched-chain amino acid transport system permease protein